MSRRALLEKWYSRGGQMHADESTEALADAACDETEALHARCDEIMGHAADFAEVTTECVAEMRRQLEQSNKRTAELERRVRRLSIEVDRLRELKVVH